MFRGVSAAFLIVATFLFALGAIAQDTAKGPVVVELFTSEGCSSCPPVDHMLGELQKQHTWNGAELIVLGEHVDYWNQLGWKDRFSSHTFTERQTAYAQETGSEVFTPELVVDGQPKLVNNKDPNSFQRAIESSAQAAMPARVTLTASTPEQLHVAVENGGKGDAVLLFITQDDLSTSVKAGENGGTTLHHTAVVREMRRIGKTKAGQFQADVPLKIDPEWQRNALRVIVLVQQDNGAGKIVGAAALRPQEGPTSAQTTASE